MRRYFFCIRRGTSLIPDPDGELRPSVEAALAEAREVARDLVVNAIRTGREIDDDQVEVQDMDGRVLGIIRLIDVLPIRKPPSGG